MTTAKMSTSNVRWRAVALPTEHGGWGFISEPILLGLLLAPTWAGLTLSIAAFAAFLLRQPLKLYLKDRRAGRDVPRTRVARRFVLIYGGIMLGAGGLTLLLAPTLAALLPLLLALPLLGVQLVADVQNRGRTLFAEAAGAGAPGAIAAALVLLAGWALPGALSLWLALALKAVTAILYVRARLRLERAEPAPVRSAIALHAVAVLVLLAVAVAGLLPWTAAAGMNILLLRATVGLSPYRKSRPAKIIGMQEIAYGIGFVLCIVLGYAFSG